MVLTPVFWNRLLDRIPRRPAPPQERAHRDGISVTAESPEAFEEILWMAFFSTLHDARRWDFLDAATRNPSFERFFRALGSAMCRERVCQIFQYSVTDLSYTNKNQHIIQ